LDERGSRSLSAFPKQSQPSSSPLPDKPVVVCFAAIEVIGIGADPGVIGLNELSEVDTEDHLERESEPKAKVLRLRPPEAVPHEQKLVEELEVVELNGELFVWQRYLISNGSPHIPVLALQVDEVQPLVNVDNVLEYAIGAIDAATQLLPVVVDLLHGQH